MAWKVKWAEVAWSDLEEVADYIAKDSSYYAAASLRGRKPAAISYSQLPIGVHCAKELNENARSKYGVKL